MVDIMCKYNADINAKNQGGNTPLHVAAQHGMVSFRINSTDIHKCITRQLSERLTITFFNDTL